MNQNNYTSLPPSQRLVAAGIVLETEFYHLPWKIGNTEGFYIAAPDTEEEWEIGIPATNLSELWRELPILIIDDKMLLPVLVKISGKEQGGILYSAFYEDLDHSRPVPVVYHNTNPCDALSELLIWVKGEKR